MSGTGGCQRKRRRTDGLSVPYPAFCRWLTSERRACARKSIPLPPSLLRLKRENNRQRIPPGGYLSLSPVILRMVFTLHSIPRQQSAHIFVSSQRTHATALPLGLFAGFLSASRAAASSTPSSPFALGLPSSSSCSSRFETPGFETRFLFISFRSFDLRTNAPPSRPLDHRIKRAGTNRS